MERFTAMHKGNEEGPVPVSFDAAVHTARFAKEGWDYFSLETCYVAVEEALMANSQALLNQVLQDEGLVGDISSSSITLIQSGSQQFIFRVRVKVATAQGEKEHSFVAGVSRCPEVTAMVEADHEILVEVRKAEAETLALLSDSEQFRLKATFPLHYGAHQTEAGPFVYLSEFCEGYAEINLRCEDDPNFDMMGDITQREVLLNGMNQGKHPRFLEEGESGGVLSELAAHQMRTALRCGLVLSPAFRGGDYLYHPEKRQVMLQCYREPKASGENGFWPELSRMVTIEGEDPDLTRLAFQILSLATHREPNLEPMEQDDDLRGHSYFSYSIIGLSTAGHILREQTGLSQADFARAVSLAVSVARQVIPGLSMSPFEQRAFLDRIQYLPMISF